MSEEVTSTEGEVDGEGTVTETPLEGTQTEVQEQDVSDQTPEDNQTDGGEEPATNETPEETPSESDFSEFFGEFEEKGNLSEESYAKLEAQGYSKDMVDTYIRGASDALTEDGVDALIAGAGGQEAYDELTDWAGRNLSEADLAKFNTALTGKTSAEMAISWLQGKMRDAEGFDPAVVLNGDPAGDPKPDVYASRQEVTKAMRDKRYGKDKAYTQEVTAKVGRSNLF